MWAVVAATEGLSGEYPLLDIAAVLVPLTLLAAYCWHRHVRLNEENILELLHGHHRWEALKRIVVGRSSRRGKGRSPRADASETPK